MSASYDSNLDDLFDCVSKSRKVLRPCESDVVVVSNEGRADKQYLNSAWCNSYSFIKSSWKRSVLHMSSRLHNGSPFHFP